MEWCGLLLLFYLLVLVTLGNGQRQPSAPDGPWTHRIQWENNGRVFSLLSTGTQFRLPAHNRRRTQLLLTTRNSYQQGNPPVAIRSTRSRPVGSEGFGVDQTQRSQMDEAVLGVDADQFIDASGRPSVPAQEFSGSGVTRGGRSTPGGDRSELSFAAPQVGQQRDPRRAGIQKSTPEQIEHSLTRDPPESRDTASNAIGVLIEDTNTTETNARRDPHSVHHRNSVFYQVNAADSRNRLPTYPPGTGQGNRLFHHGLPDLVPDPYYIQAASYIQRVQMYALRCAAEENCLSRSAYNPGVSDLDYRVLLRFPQRVKNQGTADFLPLKPRHEWEWHSCHQHYHSMEAFSNYDLLDVSTGRKVAEGHKASFCLEDTSCDRGIRRRFACTAHTQGLSPGCYDTYHANIDCQWIDITDVPPGNYILKVTVNPSRLVQELDFSNNEVRCEIRYTGSYVQARHCRVVIHSHQH